MSAERARGVGAKTDGSCSASDWNNSDKGLASVWLFSPWQEPAQLVLRPLCHIKTLGRPRLTSALQAALAEGLSPVLPTVLIGSFACFSNDLPKPCLHQTHSWLRPGGTTSTSLNFHRLVLRT